MYKVLLVDDEPMALEGLKYVIDWANLDFEICGTCWNGKEAIEAIDKYSPDVVITDIKMPVMDGLDLIGYAKEHGKDNIQFVVVSGFGEFEYAKKAMQYGIRFYLQKPILQEEIYEVILEAKKQLDETCSHEECAKMDQKAFLEGVLQNILIGSDVDKDFEYLKSSFEEDILQQEWNCIVIEFEAADNKNSRHIIRKTINKAMEKGISVFGLEQNSTSFIVLASLKQGSTISVLAESIYQSLCQVSSSRFSIGVGENVVGIKSMKHSYSTAISSLGHRFYRGMNSLIYYDDIKENVYNYEFNELIMSNKVYEAVEELDNNKIKNLIDTTFKYFIVHNIDPDIVLMFTSNMICKINGANHKKIEFMDNHTIRELKDHEKNIEDLKKFFEKFCIDTCEYLKKVRHTNSDSNIIKIEAFIKENYKRNITLRELAENVYMHPAYLGQLFIRKFGIGFNEYIHIMRIEEAKRLMKITDLKNNEIAEGLGYSNYNSFLQQFQKYNGMKPTEFRNRESEVKVAP